jgi:hypothetical protein
MVGWCYKIKRRSCCCVVVATLGGRRSKVEDEDDEGSPLAASSAQREGLRNCSQLIFSILSNSIEEFRIVMSEVDRRRSSKSVRRGEELDASGLGVLKYEKAGRKRY